MIALRRQVGQLLIAGLEGTELTAIESSWLRIVRPGGIILFRRNIEAPVQTFHLLAEAGSRSLAPLFRCVDLEGGLVDRLRDAIAPMPSLAAVAASGKRPLYLQHGKLIGREAKLLGFNVVLAPVLDLALPESRSVMRTRTFFAEAEGAIAYADAFVAGLEHSHVLGCGKHFPGLGGGALDSHLSTPTISRGMDDLWERDLLPYRRLKARLPMVMVSHASYPASGDPRPASVSGLWITDVLKRRIGYRGLVLSDDLEMGGILRHTSLEEAAIEAVAAGAHLIEICKDPSLVLRAYEALLSQAERSPAFRRIVEAAFRKIVRTKNVVGASTANKPPSPLQISRLRDEIERFRSKAPEAAPQGGN